MKLTRRVFLRASGAAAAYLGVSELDPLLSLAAPLQSRPVKRDKTLVVIFLRGGADGLNIVVPYGDPHYARLRPSIAISAPAAGRDNAALPLDDFFGLHPALAPLVPLFASELAVAAHAVGYDKNTRSHFEEQDVWETGLVGNTVHSDGWLNRHLQTSEGHSPLRAVSIGDSLPRILRGDAPAYAIRGLDELRMPQGQAGETRLKAALERAYGQQHESDRAATDGATTLLSSAARGTLDAIEQLKSISLHTPKQPYPDGALGRQLHHAAALVRAGIGVEVIEIDFGGWDTHQYQGNAAGGQLRDLLAQLGAGLAAFAADLEDRMNDVVVATLTDFGRTAAENGTFGTDHGWANCMLLLGGGVRRARRAASQPRPVVTAWPGLAPDQLHEKRDLLHATDFRDVLAELAAQHLGNANLAKVLPQHEFKPVGLVAG